MITEHEAAIEEYLRIRKKRLYNFLPVKEPQKDDGGQASSKLGKYAASSANQVWIEVLFHGGVQLVYIGSEL